MQAICDGKVLLNKEHEIMCKSKVHCIWYNTKEKYHNQDTYKVQFPMDLKPDKTCRFFIDKIIAEKE